MKQFVVI